MMNFHKTIVATLLVIAVVVLLWYFANIHLISLLLPVVLFLTITAWGSSNIRSGFFIKAACDGRLPGKVALTFDDGPVPGKTDTILNILRQNGITASFFCIGSRMKKHPDLVQRIISEGHTIGNHSYTHHPAFDLFPESKLSKELADTNSTAHQITGKKLRLFRPPYGVTTPPLARAITRNNLVTVGWNVRSLDTVIKDDQKLIDRVTENIKEGDIVLLHDTSDTTIRSLQTIIDKIREKGLDFAGVDQCIGKEAYA
jgi:peptidoglycan/xylan/chitin deacetylase (PgdA/CDA1 family)